MSSVGVRSTSHPEPAPGREKSTPRPEVWRPLVSVVLPIRNEAAHIDACLERLLEQDYPAELLEFLVVDGRSQDGTREVVQRVQQRHPQVRLRLLDNPHRIVPPALNIGIRAAQGEVVVRMDGHAKPTHDYVSKCVAALARSGAANVGGVVEPVGDTPFGQAVALATRHPLGAGDARYRIGGEAADVDTVMYGAFRRDVFERVGLFDESMVRNQDYEINVRIRAEGERVHFDPAIRFAYRPRGSVRSLWSQYAQYGWWRVETVRRHPRSLRWRQLVPPVFVGGLILSALVSPWWSPAALALVAGVGAYLAIVGTVAWRLARLAQPPANPVQVFLAFAVMHFGWSLGFLLNAASGGTFPRRAGRPAVPRLGEPVGVPATEVLR